MRIPATPWNAQPLGNMRMCFWDSIGSIIPRQVSYELSVHPRTQTRIFCDSSEFLGGKINVERVPWWQEAWKPVPYIDFLKSLHYQGTAEKYGHQHTRGLPKCCNWNVHTTSLLIQRISSHKVVRLKTQGVWFAKLNFLRICILKLDQGYTIPIFCFLQQPASCLWKLTR